MARTPSKRWVEMVEDQVRKDVRIGSIDAKSAVTLLSRQHAAFVRLVKAIPSYGRYVDGIRYADVIKRSDLLAALQQGRRF